MTVYVASLCLATTIAFKVRRVDATCGKMQGHFSQIQAQCIIESVSLFQCCGNRAGQLVRASVSLRRPAITLAATQGNLAHLLCTSDLITAARHLHSQACNLHLCVAQTMQQQQQVTMLGAASRQDVAPAVVSVATLGFANRMA